MFNKFLIMPLEHADWSEIISFSKNCLEKLISHISSIIAYFVLRFCKLRNDSIS